MIKSAIRKMRSGRLRALGRLAVNLIPDRPWQLTYGDLGRFSVRLRRHRWMYWENPLRDDARTVATFARLVRPGDVAYDIGANIGIYARMMVSWCGASRVVAVEPMTDNVRMLRDNLRLGGIEDRVDVYPIAVSDKAGEELLQIDDVSSGSAVLDGVSAGEAAASRRLQGLPPITERVKVETLDGLIEREGLPPPSFMKIDTEGAEVLVLKGAERTLRSHRPRLAIALHGDDKAAGTIALLNSLGYAVYGDVWAGGRGTGPIEHRRLVEADATRLRDNNIIASVDPVDVERRPDPATDHPARLAKSRAT